MFIKIKYLNFMFIHLSTLIFTAISPLLIIAAVLAVYLFH